MAKELYNQREFATLVGISPATVSRMIADKRIKTVSESDLRIPASEVNVIMQEQLHKFRKYNKLFLIARENDELFEITKSDVISAYDSKKKAAELRMAQADYKQKRQDIIPHYVESIDSVLAAIDDYRDSRIKDSSEISIKLQDMMIMKALVREFSIKYQELVMNKMKSIYIGKFLINVPEDAKNSMKRDEVLRQREENKVLAHIPGGVMRDLLMYGTVRTELPEDMDVEKMLSGVVPQINNLLGYMTSAFKGLVNDLCLVDINGKPLFDRADLSIDFFDEKGELYNQIISSRIRGINTELAREVVNKATNKYKNSVQNSAVENVIGDGIYMILKIDKDMDAAAVNEVCQLLNKQIFGEVAASGVSHFPDKIVDTLISADKARNYLVSMS